MGLTIGKNFVRMHGVILDPSHCWLIEIGDDVGIASGVHILAHDASTKMFLGYTRIGRVIIGNKVFIGEDTVILPNVKIGNNVVIGANSTVSNNLPDNGVYAGSPAKFICTVEDFINKHKLKMQTNPVFEKEYLLGEITDIKKKQMKEELKDKCGYII